MPSVFESYLPRAYPFEFRGRIRTVTPLAGGIPSDQRVAERWIKTKFTDGDDVIRAMAAEVMVERGIQLVSAEGESDDARAATALDEVTRTVMEKITLNGFKRNPAEGAPTHDPDHPVGELFIEGRQLKAGMKEAGSICVAAEKLPARGWGKTNKGIKNFLAEHFCVIEDRLYLGVEQPTDVQQRFVHTYQGSGIQYEETVAHAEFEFTVLTDVNFTPEQWALLWLTAEQQGIGATRSQGFGRYEVTQWDQVR